MAATFPRWLPFPAQKYYFLGNFLLNCPILTILLSNHTFLTTEKPYLKLWRGYKASFYHISAIERKTTAYWASFAEGIVTMDNIDHNP